MGLLFHHSYLQKLLMMFIINFLSAHYQNAVKWPWVIMSTTLVQKKKKKNWSEKHILKIMFVLKTVILLPIHEMYKM